MLFFVLYFVQISLFNPILLSQWFLHQFFLLKKIDLSNETHLGKDVNMKKKNCDLSGVHVIGDNHFFMVLLP